MPTQQGTAHLFGVPAVMTFFDPDNTAMATVYVTPNIQGIKINHSGEVQKIKSTGGEITGLIGSGDYITCSFDYIFEGTSIANAKASAQIPQLLSTCTVTGLPIIACGPFTDGFNTDVGNTQRWIYEGGGSGDYKNAAAGTGTVTLNRYIGIPATTLAILVGQ